MSSEFEAAAAEVKDLKETPGHEELLELYGLYKIGTGANFESAAKPGTFDFKGKAKYNTWQKLVNEGITQDQAQKKYIELVGQLKTKYGKK